MLDPSQASTCSHFYDLVDDITLHCGIDRNLAIKVLSRLALDEACALAFGLDPYNDLESIREEKADAEETRNELLDQCTNAVNALDDMLDNFKLSMKARIKLEDIRRGLNA